MKNVGYYMTPNKADQELYQKYHKKYHLFMLASLIFFFAFLIFTFTTFGEVIDGGEAGVMLMLMIPFFSCWILGLIYDYKAIMYFMRRSGWRNGYES